VPGNDDFRIEPEDEVEGLQPFRAGAMPAHGRALMEDHVSRKDNPSAAREQSCPRPVAWPDVNHVNLQAFEIQHESFVEQRRRKRRLDPVEVVVLPQLPTDC